MIKCNKCYIEICFLCRRLWHGDVDCDDAPIKVMENITPYVEVVRVEPEVDEQAENDVEEEKKGEGEDEAKGGKKKPKPKPKPKSKPKPKPPVANARA